MFKKYMYRISLLLFGIGMVAVGIGILLQGQFILSVATDVGGLLLLLHGAHLLINAKFKNLDRQHRITTVFSAVANIAGGLVMLLLANITAIALLVLFILYVEINAMTKLIDYITGRKANYNGRRSDFIAFLFYTVFAIIMVFVPNMGMPSLLLVSGCYCILYGVSQISDFCAQVFPLRPKTDFNRPFRVSVPAFVSAFMPMRFIRRAKKKQTGKLNLEKIQIHKDDTPIAVEVLIHINDTGTGQMGHADLVVDGIVYSYGNYDLDSSYVMRLYGDGVLYTVDKNPYIRFSIENDKKTIIGYGIRLSPKQIEKVRDEVSRLMADAYTWRTQYERRLEQDESAVLDEQYTFCSHIWCKLGAHCYKFKQGRFKSYFVLSTNCVLLIDRILGAAGTHQVKTDGIITPGSYFAYLEQECAKRDGIVSSRTVYNEKTMDLLKANQQISQGKEELQWEKT